MTPSAEYKAIVKNVNLASTHDNHDDIYYWGIIAYKQDAAAPKRAWGPPVFISKFKFLWDKQPIGI